jgi:imidazolonepropionase-like amidohydrolase
MNNLRAFILCIIFFSFLPVHGQYYLSHINVIDVEKGSILKDQTICIEGNTIKSISRRPIKIPTAPIYDCSGKYVLPGLWGYAYP